MYKPKDIEVLLIRENIFEVEFYHTKDDGHFKYDRFLYLGAGSNHIVYMFNCLHNFLPKGFVYNHNV